jgi:hypothetical protein
MLRASTCCSGHPDSQIAEHHARAAVASDAIVNVKSTAANIRHWRTAIKCPSDGLTYDFHHKTALIRFEAKNVLNDVPHFFIGQPDIGHCRVGRLKPSR